MLALADVLVLGLQVGETGRHTDGSRLLVGGAGGLGLGPEEGLFAVMDDAPSATYVVQNHEMVGFCSRDRRLRNPVIEGH